MNRNTKNRVTQNCALLSVRLIIVLGILFTTNNAFADAMKNIYELQEDGNYTLANAGVEVVVKDVAGENLHNAKVKLISILDKEQFDLKYNEDRKFFSSEDMLKNGSYLVLIECEGFEPLKGRFELGSKNRFVYLLLKYRGVIYNSGIKLERKESERFLALRLNEESCKWNQSQLRLLNEIFEVRPDEIYDKEMFNFFKLIQDFQCSIAYSDDRIVIIKNDFNTENSLNNLFSELSTNPYIKDFGEVKSDNGTYLGFYTNRYLIYWNEKNELEKDVLLKKYGLRLIEDREGISLTELISSFETAKKIVQIAELEGAVDAVDREFIQYKILDK